MLISEQEKNQIRRLHQEYSIIKESSKDLYEGTYNDEVFPGPEESAISRFLKSIPEGGKPGMSGQEQKANEILKYIEFEVRGWLFDKNKRVTQETPGYFLENNSKMATKIAEILSK